MSICRICNHTDNKHFPECPFSNILPKTPPFIPPKKIDYWLATEDGRKQIKKDFEKGKYHYLGNGIFQEA